MTELELFQLAQCGVNISISIPLQELMQIVHETDRLATERSRREHELNKLVPNRMMTTNEFCQFWGITNKTLHNWEKRKIVKLTRVGGEIRIDPEEIQRLRAMRNMNIQNQLHKSSTIV